MTLTTNATKVIKSVVVVRHGERLDYVMRDAGDNWIPGEKEPWNPPLTKNGKQQAKLLGKALPEILQNLNLPSIGAIYTSPFLRCRQTAAGLLLGSSSSSSSDNNNNNKNDNSDKIIKVRVELGLAESINENFFRSWAVFGTNGTWGYMKKERPILDPDTLHPASKLPVQVSGILNWRKDSDEIVSDDDDNEIYDDGGTSLKEMMDHQYESTTIIETPFSLHPPKFESFKMQRNRMADTMKKLSTSHPNETIILVSHGGPVTHLYESLTGNKWDVHGVSKYCCYSIYELKDSNFPEDCDNNNADDHNNNKWTPLVVNQVLGGEKTTDDNNINNNKKDDDDDTTTPKTFTWA